MAKWRTLGISILKDSKIERGRQFCDITKKFFELALEGKRDEIKKDEFFDDWKKVIW